LHLRRARSKTKVRDARHYRGDDDIGPRKRVDGLRSMEHAGLSQVFINPPMDGYNDCIDEISRDVIARM